MFDGLKRLLMGNKTASKTASSTPLVPEILGLRLGGSFTIDAFKLEIIEPCLTIDGASPTHNIDAVGVIELDAQRKIVRYYTDDEGYLQIQLYGKDIEEITLWYFFDTKGLQENQWQPVLNNQVVIGEYHLDEQVFSQFWEGTTPVVLTEKTHHANGQIDETDQFCMVYTRDVKNSHIECELLLISAEEKRNAVTQSFDYELVRSTGFALNSIDIRNN